LDCNSRFININNLKWNVICVFVKKKQIGEHYLLTIEKKMLKNIIIVIFVKNTRKKKIAFGKNLRRFQIIKKNSFDLDFFN